MSLSLGSTLDIQGLDINLGLALWAPYGSPSFPGLLSLRLLVTQGGLDHACFAHRCKRIAYISAQHTVSVH